MFSTTIIDVHSPFEQIVSLSNSSGEFVGCIARSVFDWSEPVSYDHAEQQQGHGPFYNLMLNLKLHKSFKVFLNKCF